MRTGAFSAGREFIEREGRLIERRLAANLFDGAPSHGVLDAVRAYRNEDGGFGHGFEPDKRCPHSLPIDVECALDVMITADVRDEPMITAACDWLAMVAAPNGAVALCSRSWSATRERSTGRSGPTRLV